MTEGNVNPSEKTQEETVAAAEGAEPETTDAPEGVADVENVPDEAAPDEAGEPAAEPEPPETEPATEEPAPAAEASPPSEPEAVGDETVAEMVPVVDEEPAEEAAEAVEEEPVPEESAALSQARDLPAPEPDVEPAAVSEPKKKKKRLPRPLRRQRTKTTRERPTERKPITRLPKQEHAHGRRQERQGKVVSAASDKTIVVRVDTVKVHPMYKKVIRRSTKLHAHDAENQAKIGDVVRIVETRPISKQKRWRLQEIVEAAK
ncbi:MAG: 30S ribosomal protein S17 [Gaiellaceae bacterium]